MSKADATVRLNLGDFIYLTMEDVMPSQGNLLTLRFKESHDVTEIRDAMRHTISIYPRLRSIVEPTLFSYKLRILNDNDERLDVLFKNAFRVKLNLKYDSHEYLTFRRNLYNEPFALEQTIPIKIYYFPDGPTSVLVLSIHHVVGDGSSCVHIACSIMSYLNGKKPSLVPIDNPSLTPALFVTPYYKIPMQLYKSTRLLLRDRREAQKGTFIPATNRPIDFFGPVDIYYHTLCYDLELIKSKSKKLGVSITTLLLVAISHSLSKGPGRDTGNMIGIIISADLRPFFEGQTPVIGNYVTGFMVVISREYWDNPKQMLEEINFQMTKHIDRIKQKQASLPLLFHKLFTLVGKKNYARGVRIMKKKGILTKTCSLANLGNVDILNSYGPKAQLCEFDASGPSHGLFIAMNTLEGKIHMSFTFQEAEFTREEIKKTIQGFERSLGKLLKL
ncbi:MAG: hypothetical protein J7L53_09380 [Deltaproteobacteria bacterium]|nr:hypothetical protein [Deltaproteobacteria bacterium]